MTKRLSADWQAAYGHPLLLAERFVDPKPFSGTLYAATNWCLLGTSKGYARSNGRYIESHGNPRQLYGMPLRRDACR